MRWSRWLALALLPLPAICFFHGSSNLDSSNFLVGRVLDDVGPVASASVQLQGRCRRALTDAAGKFRLPADGNSARITATKPGYAIGWADLGLGPASIRLTALPPSDNADYQWVDPGPDPRKPFQCANCHEAIYREWAGSAHARSSANGRVLALFGGRDSPLGKDWNLLEQHPLGAGVCASCHAPTMSSPALDYDLRTVSGVAARGVHCDYCHKIADAPTDKLGTRFGRDGYPLLRPEGESQLFFGPLPDAVRAGETFVHAPFYKESRYCASCHEGVIFGVHVYGTYSEWLESPQASQGMHCQDCHMKPTGKMRNIAPGKGGIERNPATLAGHGLPGGDLAMLKSCLKLDAALRTSGGKTIVDVRITADNVGHRVPTGFIDRHLVLIVDASDAEGKNLLPQSGPILPAWAGNNAAGMAGYLYAKLLLDDQGQAPRPFWLPSETLSDTRLFPGRTDHKQFAFSEAPGGRVRIRLIYRRLWPDVARWIEGQENERVIAERELIME